MRNKRKEVMSLSPEYALGFKEWCIVQAQNAPKHVWQKHALVRIGAWLFSRSQMLSLAGKTPVDMGVDSFETVSVWYLIYKKRYQKVWC